MPTDDDYGRRERLLLHQQQQQQQSGSSSQYSSNNQQQQSLLPTASPLHAGAGGGGGGSSSNTAGNNSNSNNVDYYHHHGSKQQQQQQQNDPLLARQISQSLMGEHHRYGGVLRGSGGGSYVSNVASQAAAEANTYQLPSAAERSHQGTKGSNSNGNEYANAAAVLHHHHHHQQQQQHHHHHHQHSAAAQGGGGSAPFSPETFPSPPSPAPASDCFVPPPPLSPGTPAAAAAAATAAGPQSSGNNSNKYQPSQSVAGYTAADRILAAGSSIAQQQLLGRSASPAKEQQQQQQQRFASSERLLGASEANKDQQQQQQQRYCVSSSTERLLASPVLGAVGLHQSHRLLSSSPIHAPVPERFASGNGNASSGSGGVNNGSRSSPLHDRYYHGSSCSESRYLTSCSPNPEGRYSSSERILGSESQQQQQRRYSQDHGEATSLCQKYGTHDPRTSASPAPDYGASGNSARYQAYQDCQNNGSERGSSRGAYQSGGDRFNDLAMQRFAAQSRPLDRFAAAEQRYLSSGGGGGAAAGTTGHDVRQSNTVEIARYTCNASTERLLSSSSSPSLTEATSIGSSNRHYGISAGSQNVVNGGGGGSSSSSSYLSPQSDGANPSGHCYSQQQSSKHQHHQHHHHQQQHQMSKSVQSSYDHLADVDHAPRYSDRYSDLESSGAGGRYGRGDRYHCATTDRYSPAHAHHHVDKYLSLPKPKDRYSTTTSGRIGAGGSCGASGSSSSDRAYGSSGGSYVPPAAHTPVERYVPQPPPEVLYPERFSDRYTTTTSTTTERFVLAAEAAASNGSNGGESSYLRSFHYRLPPSGYPYQTAPHQSHFRLRGGLNYQSPARLSGSPGSSSTGSSSSNAQRDSSFSTSPLLRPKNRDYAKQQQQQQQQQQQPQCCLETSSQPSSTQQQSQTRAAQQTASCCQQVRRSVPPGALSTIPQQASAAAAAASWQASPNSATTNSSSISDGSEQQQSQQQQSLNLYPVSQQQQSTESSSTTPTTSSTASTATCPAGGGSSGNSSTTSSSQQQQSSLQSNVQRSVSAPAGPRPQMLSTGSNTSATSTPIPGTNQRQGNNNGNRTLRRNQSRTEAIKNYIKRETATFFGVDEESEAVERQKWLDRRRRMASRKYGALLPEYKPPDPDITKDVPDALEVTDSVTLRKWQRPVRTKDSVARMTLSGIQYLVDTLRRQRPLSDRGETSRSFPPSATHTTEDAAVHTDEGATSDPNAEDDDEEEAFFRAPQGLQQQQQQQQQVDGQSQLTDEIMSAVQGKSIDVEDGGGAAAVGGVGAGAAASAATLESIRIGVDTMWSAESLTSADKQQQHPEERVSIDGHSRRAAHKAISSKDHYTLRTRPEPEVQYHHPQAEAILPRVKTTFGGKRIHPSTIDRVFDNSNRRLYGMGIVGRFFGRSFRKSVAQKPDVRRQLDDFEDHRPYFTYWITTVQLLILIISLACYGFGPVGLDLHHRSSLVLVTSLSLQQVEYQEPANFWLGPRASDLIHLGAKFAPCMRRDIKILKEIDVWREKERDTACCIRNDDSGCVQSSRAECSNTISTWKKWGPADSGPGGRISGSVCGLDPKFCDAPASIAPYEWPDDITKWPICRKINPFSQRFRSKQESNGPGNANFPIGYKDKMAEHMVCEVIGHPCCIGIHGTCRITTKEYCDFVHGYFHEEASLCSQVECLHDVCGMIPFLHPEWPDQFYRLFTTTFLHAGIFHIAITLLVQYFLMRDLEKLTGSVRIALIYFIGALAGNLASAIFVPYRAEVGPAGAHFALLATLVVEVLHCWPMLKYPRRALSKLMIILVGLLLLGVLPWVDNYAHLFGFIFGFLAAYALMPFISFGHYDRRRKIFVIWICSLLILGLFGLLLALFYNVPMYECELCKLFNCIPFTRDFCASQNINFKREEPV